MGKEEWKNTGKELGDAFQDLAKSVIRSAKAGIDKAEEWAEGEETESSNVFNDGTWRETGKTIGHAMKSLGQSIINTGMESAEKAEEWAEENNEPKDPEN